MLVAEEVLIAGVVGAGRAVLDEYERIITSRQTTWGRHRAGTNWTGASGDTLRWRRAFMSRSLSTASRIGAPARLD